VKTNKKATRAARRLFRVCLVDGLPAERRVRHVVRRLAASNRRGAVAILSSFARLVRLNMDRRTARVESAAPLGPELRKDIRNGLVRMYGPGLKTMFERNQDLIGGLRIKVGSDVYDDSVRAKLAALAARL
jgi:F-type H+-transporting ATPase subunit delta